VCDLETSRIGAPYIYIYDISSLRVNHIGSGQEPKSDFCLPSVFVNAFNFLAALIIISSSQTTKLGRWVLGFHTMILAGTLYLFYLCIILFIYLHSALFYGAMRAAVDYITATENQSEQH